MRLATFKKRGLLLYTRKRKKKSIGSSFKKVGNLLGVRQNGRKLDLTWSRIRGGGGLLNERHRAKYDKKKNRTSSKNVKTNRARDTPHGKKGWFVSGGKGKNAQLFCGAVVFQWGKGKKNQGAIEGVNGKP